MAALKAIILDFDGVILESADIRTRAFSRVFSGYPERLDEIVQHHLDNVSLSRYEKFRYVYENILIKPLSPEEMEELGQRFADYSLEEVKGCPEVEGASELFEAYSNHFLLFVASGTPEPELREIVGARGLSQHFAGVFGSPRWKRDICADILRQWRLEPSEALFVGDSLTDFQEALQVGIPFVGRVRPGGETFQGLGVPTVADLHEFKQLLETGLPSSTPSPGGLLGG